jgi:hypothetical protein
MANEPTKIQRVILEAAARSANLVAWPLPKKLGLSAGSAAIVIRGLLQKGFLEKRPAVGADAVWRELDGMRLTLVVTRAGLAACGIEASVQPDQNGHTAANKAGPGAVSEDDPRTPRAGTKLAILAALLARDEGATVAEMATATGWQAHSVRGVLSGALVRRFGLEIVSEKTEGQRVYRAIGGSG